MGIGGGTTRAVRPDFGKKHVKGRQRSQFDQLEFHELRLTKGKLLKDGVRLCGRAHIHQETGPSDPDEPTSVRSCHRDRA
jgi:hypothetical protein